MLSCIKYCLGLAQFCHGLAAFILGMWRMPLCDKICLGLVLFLGGSTVAATFMLPVFPRGVPILWVCASVLITGVGLVLHLVWTCCCGARCALD